MSESEKLEELIEKLIYQKDVDQRLMMNKFNKNWLLSVLQESDEIRNVELRFKDYDVKGVDIIDFVRIFLNIIEHRERETLYIVIGLIDLFKEICETFNLGNHIRSTDIINYVVDVRSFNLNINMILTYFNIDLHQQYPINYACDSHPQNPGEKTFWRNTNTHSRNRHCK